MSNEKILEIKDLRVQYITEDGTVKAVEGLNLRLVKGETLGIVGETGAGKTTTALSIMQLVPDPPGKILSGEIIFKNQNILEKSKDEMRKIRGKEISMVFQDPMTSLNPVLTVGEQISEVLEMHENLRGRELRERIVDVLEAVGIPGERRNEYPYQFSGGMRQRVLIAIALSCNPSLLIADEPTTALDVTIQAQILEVIGELKEKFDTTMIMITHDLGVVAETCDKVAVMYAGRIVEYGNRVQIFTQAKHPYTIGLFNSIPNIEEDEGTLHPIKGLMPDPTDLPTGCVFHPRCDQAMDKCKTVVPREIDFEGHKVRCLLFDK